jgi:endonuclease/exonuclease/phosphatase family metal-dependent hydrolase
MRAKVLAAFTRRFFLYSAAFISLALLGCTATEHYVCSARPLEKNPNLKVMTFNIRYGTADDGHNSWQYRRELVFDVICGYRADVIGLQEALRFQIDQIRTAVPAYGEIGFGREDGKEKGEYCSILYRKDRFKIADSGTFWFSNSPWIPGSIHWGNACTRICTWARLVERQTSKAFYVYNLHLDHVSQPSREKSAELLTKKISQREYPDPFIVMGDFNVGEDNKVIHYLRGWTEENRSPVIMIDSFRLAHPDEQMLGTFNAFEGKKGGDKIDYIFTEVTTRVYSAEIIRTNTNGRYPSDHFPVTAELGLLGK